MRSFIAVPRFVTHIDDGAIAVVTQVYRERLAAGGTVLDLMSSWISHLPDDVAYASVVGHGMNARRLAANPRFSRWFVQDLNIDPGLFRWRILILMARVFAFRFSTCSGPWTYSAMFAACCGLARHSLYHFLIDASRPRPSRSGSRCMGKISSAWSPLTCREPALAILLGMLRCRWTAIHCGWSLGIA